MQIYNAKIDAARHRHTAETNAAWDEYIGALKAAAWRHSAQPLTGADPTDDVLR